MPYKLLIADDEPIILKHLKNSIDWRNIGFEISGIFSDGEDVIDYLNSNKPCDVILSDIKMFKVSGTELAKYVYENKPEIKVILFSGYRDFENAVEALKYNVENYLLKPLKTTELIAVFEDLKKKLDEQKSDAILKNYLLREILINLKNGIYHDKSKLLEKLSPFNLSFISDNAAFFFKIKLDSPYECAEENIRANIFQNFVSERESGIIGYYMQGTNYEIEYFLSAQNKSRDFLTAYAENISKNITELIKIKAYLSEFIYYKCIDELIETKNHTLPVEKHINDFKTQLINAINSNETSDITAITETILEMFTGLQPKEQRDMIKSLTNDILTTLKIDVTPEYDFEKVLSECTDFESLKDFAKNYFVGLGNLSSMHDDLTRKSVILWARKYIEDHCGDELTLEKISSMVYLSPTYFSKLFKNITGQNYIDFLITCRMNSAKKLLITTTLKVSEIGIRVGYVNASFFNRLFKKNCGVTPTEYRIKYTKGGY